MTGGKKQLDVNCTRDLPCHDNFSLSWLFTFTDDIVLMIMNVATKITIASNLVFPLACPGSLAYIRELLVGSHQLHSDLRTDSIR